jgi:hypothetical protein
MSANKKIDLSKYRYVYYVATGELYEVDGWKSLGRYADIGGLVGYEVKSWKPFRVRRLIDGLVVDNKAGSEVYLGVRL